MPRFLRGQSLAEFMILLSVIIVYFLVFADVYGSQKTMQYELTESLNGKETADLFASAANEVYIGGNGSTSSVYLDSAFQNISIVGSNVQVQRAHSLVQSPLLLTEVSGNFSPGQKTVLNVNGNVSIS